MPKCDPGSCKLVLYSFTVLPAAGSARASFPVRVVLVMTGILDLLPSVKLPGPKKIAAMMVPAFDLASRDGLIATDFMSAFDARFHCRS